MVSFSAILLSGFRISISNLRPGPPLEDMNLSPQVPVHRHEPKRSKQPQAAANQGEFNLRGISESAGSGRAQEHVSKHEEFGRDHQAHQEDAPLLGQQDMTQHSLGAMLGLLVSAACGFGGFVDGMTILPQHHSDFWKTAVRVARAAIEAYSVGHLLLFRDHRSRQMSVIAVYWLVLALPSGLVTSAVFGESLALETAASLFIRWVLLSLSFGIACYVIIFHLINKAFNSSDRKKTHYSLFFAGQLVAFWLVASTS